MKTVIVTLTDSVVCRWFSIQELVPPVNVEVIGIDYSHNVYKFRRIGDKDEWEWKCNIFWESNDSPAFWAFMPIIEEEEVHDSSEVFPNNEYKYRVVR
jgi:hypothetical protein